MKIYVINLPDSLDRRQHIKSQLDSSNMPFEFISAVDVRNLSEIEQKNLYDCEKAKLYKRELTLGEIGCALSHRAVYKKMIDENIDRAIILEDDITLKPEFYNLLQYFDKLPIKRYVIKFERLKQEIIDDNNFKCARFTPWYRMKISNEYFTGQPLYSPTLTWGYYIDLAAARKLYSIMPKVFLVADAWWYYRKFIIIRMLNKAVISTNDDQFVSTIGNRNFYANTPGIKKTFFYFLKKEIKDFIRMFLLVFEYSPTLYKKWKK